MNRPGRRRGAQHVALAAVAAVTVLAAVAPATAHAPPTADTGEEQRWIVTLSGDGDGDGGDGDLAGADLPGDAEVAMVLDEVDAVAVDATASEVDELRRDGRVAAVEPVRELELVLDRAGPVLGLPVAAAHGLDGTGRQVAVVDTGVDAAHATFAGAPVTEVCFAASGTSCPGGGPSAAGPGAAAPPCGTASCLHGTHVAGIAVGRGGGGTAPGVAPGAGLVAVRIFSMRSGRLVADTASLLAGLDHVLALRQAGEPIDAVNLSLVATASGLFGGHCDARAGVSVATRDAIDQLTSLGVLVVVASGNQGSPTAVAEPACFSRALAVGASDLGPPERVATFTNSGPAMDLLAPGVAIRSAGGAGAAMVSSGTSSAAPFVAGAVAALRSGSPALPVARVRAVLGDAAVLVDDPSRGRFLRLDVAATVLSLGDGVGVGAGGRLSHLRNSPTAGRPARSFGYGRTSDRLLVGDWDGDGVDTYGVRRGSTVILTDDPAGGIGQVSFSYGWATDEVLVGDWDGDGRDTIGIRRGTTFHLRNSLSSGVADVTFPLGEPGDRVLVGDWDGDGIDSIGLHRGAGFHLRNPLSTGPADLAFGYGRVGDVPVVGDWTGRGVDTVGIRRGNHWYLRTSNTAGNAELDFAFGSATTPPIVGNWDGT